MLKIFYRSLMIIIASFLLTQWTLAMSLDIPNQTIILKKELRLNLSPVNGNPPFTYAIKKTNIPKTEWKIYNHEFIWTPQKIGVYYAVLVVIDDNSNILEKEINFSVIKEKTTNTTNTTNSSSTPTKPNANYSHDIKYLRSVHNYPQILSQAGISLYYTEGIFPANITLKDASNQLSLTCAKNTQFSFQNSAYFKKIPSPSFLGSLKAKNDYNVKWSKNDKFAVLVDLPGNLKIEGNCYLEIQKEGANTYREQKIDTKIASSKKAWTSKNKIPVKNGAVFVFSKEKTDEPSKPVINATLGKRSPFLQSLLSQPPFRSWQSKKDQSVLTRAELAYLIVNSIANNKDSISVPKNAKAYRDITAKTPYRQEIYIWKKLGYASAIDKEFEAHSNASWRDFYFSVSKHLGLQLKWYQEDLLVKKLQELKILNGKSQLANKLTLLDASRMVMEIQEVYTKRGRPILTLQEPEIQNAIEKEWISALQADNARKEGNISRGLLLKILIQKAKLQSSAENILEDYFADSPQKIVFDNVKASDAIAPYLAYFYHNSLLPAAWLSEKTFDENQTINKAEVLEISLRFFNKWNTASQCRDIFWADIGVHKSNRHWDYASHYVGKEKLWPQYLDRYQNELNLFLPEQEINLQELFQFLQNL